MTFSERIKALRLEKGLTLEQVGDKVGVGKSTVRKWENGIIANMRRDKIAKLADALGVTPAYLMGWAEKPDGHPFETTHIETDDPTINRLLGYVLTLNNAGREKLLERAEELKEIPKYGNRIPEEEKKWQ